MTRTLGVAVATGVAVLLVGCGGSKPEAGEAPRSGGATSTPTSASASPTPASPSPSVAASVDGVALMERITPVMLGEPMTMSGDVSVSGQSISIEGAFDSSGPRPLMRADLGGGLGSVRVIGPDIWIELPQGSPGRPWVHVDDRTAPPELQALVGEVGRGTNPTGNFGMFAAAGDLTDAGPDTVAGVEVREYAGQVDLDRALAGLSGAERDNARTLVKAGYQTVDFVLGVDAEDRLRRFEMSVYGDGVPPTAVHTVYGDFGEPVSVEPPPQRLVREL